MAPRDTDKQGEHAILCLLHPNAIQALGEMSPMIAQPNVLIEMLKILLSFSTGFHTGRTYGCFVWGRGGFWVSGILKWKLMFNPAANWACISRWSNADMSMNVGQCRTASYLCQVNRTDVFTATSVYESFVLAAGCCFPDVYRCLGSSLSYVTTTCFLWCVLYRER